MSEYTERDIMEQGEHYSRHVNAMTAEGLHSKSDIAAELAWRDMQIAQLKHDHMQELGELVIKRALVTYLQNRELELVAQVEMLKRGVCDLTAESISQEVQLEKISELLDEVIGGMSSSCAKDLYDKGIRYVN